MQFILSVYLQDLFIDLYIYFYLVYLFYYKQFLVENRKPLIPACITSSLEQTFGFTTSALS